MSRGIPKSKQAKTFGQYEKGRSRLFILSINETTILILQKVQFPVRTSSTVATVSNHFIIVFKIIRSSFSVV